MAGVLRAAIASLVVLSTLGCSPSEEEQRDSFVRWMNRGKAHLERRESAPAIDAFSRVLERRPGSVAALRNLARAHMLAREPAPALQALAAARAAQAEDSPATEYLTGLCLALRGDLEAAVEPLRRAVTLDPDVAALRFQLARAYQATGRYQRAAQQLEETVRLDPHHTSAHYQLASHAARSGDTQARERHLREVTRLRRLFGSRESSPDEVAACRYTRAEPPPAAPRPLEEDAPFPVRFDDGTARFLPEAGPALVARVLQVDPAGRETLVVVEPDGTVTLLELPGWKRRPIDGRSMLGASIEGCIVGNVHDEVPENEKYDPERHARNDVLLWGTDGIHLLERTREGGLHDITPSSRLPSSPVRRAAWIDYEHDGDLDVLVADDEGLSLWQNNGNGQFVSVSSTVGLALAGPVYDVVSADLDTNTAMDIVVARGRKPTAVFENQRAGRFAMQLDLIEQLAS